VDIYIDPTLAYPDACTAAALAGPLGPCVYAIKPGIQCVTADLLVDKIAVAINHRMGHAFANTLALPLLWTAMEPAARHPYVLLPPALQARVSKAFIDAGGSPALNPVQRVSIHVTGEGGQLRLVQLHSIDEMNDSINGVDDPIPRRVSTNTSQQTRPQQIWTLLRCTHKCSLCNDKLLT
jgi:hypothetical protein